MKGIAASQFQVLERRMRSFERSFQVMSDICSSLDMQSISHPFVASPGPLGIILMTSETGLLGGLDRQVVIRGFQELGEVPGEFIVIGERGRRYLTERGVVHRAYPGVRDHDGERHQQACQLRDVCLRWVLEGHVGTVKAVYPRPLSFTTQRVEVATLLPCGAWGGGRSSAVERTTLLLESRGPDLVEYLAWLWVGQQLHEIFGWSRLAELAARSLHLEGSVQELRTRVRKFQQQYSRGRHELIDRDMRDLFASRLLYGTSHA